ncbi:hypothetical protein BLNAU_23551 [Blattamonas nauphoetae]|uniref:Uncharacterized protein n=1 Tax=Blattamonas nauphoetae TaxID=2049346 RepID=A0ABQ9WPX2_9EUKA|nr:hypothetical protein BLNAU_23551 [Blattamonas nauphoetae]
MAWFGMDDAGMSVYFPFFSTSRDVLDSDRENGKQNSQPFSFNSLSWMSNVISNFVQPNYVYLMDEARQWRDQQQPRVITEFKQTLSTALHLAKRDEIAAKELVTQITILYFAARYRITQISGKPPPRVECRTYQYM